MFSSLLAALAAIFPHSRTAVGSATAALLSSAPYAKDLVADTWTYRDGAYARYKASQDARRATIEDSARLAHLAQEEFERCRADIHPDRAQAINDALHIYVAERYQQSENMIRHFAAVTGQGNITVPVHFTEPSDTQRAWSLTDAPFTSSKRTFPWSSTGSPIIHVPLTTSGSPNNPALDERTLIRSIIDDVSSADTPDVRARERAAQDTYAQGALLARELQNVLMHRPDHELATHNRIFAIRGSLSAALVAGVYMGASPEYLAVIGVLNGGFSTLSPTATWYKRRKYEARANQFPLEVCSKEQLQKYLEYLSKIHQDQERNATLLPAPLKSAATIALKAQGYTSLPRRIHSLEQELSKRDEGK